MEQHEFRDQLAQGLMRLDHVLEQRLDESQSAVMPAPIQADHLVSEGIAPGNALAQIIRRMSARFATQGKEQLTETSRTLRTQGIRPTQDVFFYTDAQAMNIISHAIEERIILEHLQSEVYAGFQRLSLLGHQLRRYRPLVENANYVYVYGMNDVTANTPVAAFEHPRLIRFDIKPKLGTGMEWFWFVVVDDPRFQMALLAQQTDGDLWAPKQKQRTYTGLWTFDPAVTLEIISVLRQAGRTLFYAK